MKVGFIFFLIFNLLFIEASMASTEDTCSAPKWCKERQLMLEKLVDVNRKFKGVSKEFNSFKSEMIEFKEQQSILLCLFIISLRMIV